MQLLLPEIIMICHISYQEYEEIRWINHFPDHVVIFELEDQNRIHEFDQFEIKVK